MNNVELLKSELEKFGLSPKKKLGQNFLVDEGALEKIIQAADLDGGDNVLEIGPGMGILTNELVEKAGKVIAVEKDKDAVNYLKARIKNPKPGIIEDDILKINLPGLIEENNFQNYKVVANIPYYITGKLLRIFFEAPVRPSLIVFLVQKEVAERVCAKPGKMSKLAVSVQMEGDPSIIAKVSKESFWPQPKVDSAILKIVVNRERKFSNEEKEKIFRIVRIGFSSPRKTLANNLAAGLDLKKNKTQEILKKISIDPRVRAEDLSLKEWEKLADEFKNLWKK